MTMTPEEKAEFKRRQRSRNIAVALILFGFVALFYFVAIVRIGEHG